MPVPCFVAVLTASCLLSGSMSFFLVVEGQSTIALLLATDGQWQRWLATAPEFLATIALALLGGVVDYMQTSIAGGKFVMLHLIVRCMIAVFAGIVVAELAAAAGAPDRLRNAMIALAGYMGPRALQPLEARFNKFMGGGNA